MKRWLAAVAALCIGLVACGDEQPTELRTLKVSFAPFMSAYPLYLAQERGLFADEGLEIELVDVRTSRDVIGVLAQGDVDIVAATLTPALINAVVRGGEIKAVATLGQVDEVGAECDRLGVMVSTELLDSGEISEPADLRGRKLLGRDSGSGGYMVSVLLQEGGLSVDDVEWVPADGAEIVQKFGQGDAHVGLTTEPSVTRLTEEGTARMWRGASTLAPGLDTTVIVYGPTMLEDGDDTGVRFLRAFVSALEAYDEGKTPEHIARMSEFTELGPDVVETACWPRYGDGTVNWAGMEDLQTFYLERGLIDRSLTREEFLDEDLLGEARRSI